ncbi:MAG: MoxR family ATPase [Verrucomicrobiota bacterium]
MDDNLRKALGQLDQIILGKPDVLRLALASLLAKGHVLIEDVPGVGKTTLATALARCLGLEMKRIQFTSDMLPGDIVGTSIFEAAKSEFIFHPGALFTQVVMADEVNRASPKTQSALLEAMEEGRVSVDGIRHPLPDPFFVIATQNPGYQRGTFPLPESQLDRFMMKLSLGFPGRDAERDLLSGPNRRDLIDGLEPLFSGEELVALQQKIPEVETADPLLDYVLDLLTYTRETGAENTGLSPRAGMALTRSAQAWAYLEGRPMVIPEDIQKVAPYVLGHRLSAATGADAQTGHAMVQELLSKVPIK